MRCGLADRPFTAGHRPLGRVLGDGAAGAGRRDRARRSAGSRATLGLALRFARAAIPRDKPPTATRVRLVELLKRGVGPSPSRRAECQDRSHGHRLVGPHRGTRGDITNGRTGSAPGRDHRRSDQRQTPVISASSPCRRRCLGDHRVLPVGEPVKRSGSSSPRSAPTSSVSVYAADRDEDRQTVAMTTPPPPDFETARLPADRPGCVRASFRGHAGAGRWSPGAGHPMGFLPGTIWIIIGPCPLCAGLHWCCPSRRGARPLHGRWPATTGPVAGRRDVAVVSHGDLLACWHWCGQRAGREPVGCLLHRDDHPDRLSWSVPAIPAPGRVSEVSDRVALLMLAVVSVVGSRNHLG